MMLDLINRQAKYIIIDQSPKQIKNQINIKNKQMTGDENSLSPEHNQIKPLTVQDEKIPQIKKYNNERLDKDYQISVDLIAETSLDNSMTNALSQQEKISMVLELKSIHLEWLNIKKIQNLQVFEKLTVLYLQNNKIKKIENLQCLQNLEYLALNDNQISRVQNVKHLFKLQGLNLNNNMIEDMDAKELPPNLQLLSFKNNPITLDANYKKDIIKTLKALQVLDDVVISAQQKIKALGKFPKQLMQYSHQMSQFRKKKEIEKSLQQENKPILLGGEIINQKQAQSQIRSKTRKLLYENQQTFKREIKQATQDFEQKVTVSRNIRHIKEEEEKNRKQKLQEIKSKKLEQIDREIDKIKKSVKAHFHKSPQATTQSQ